MTTDTGQHWEAIWAGRRPDELSWFQARPERSVELITSLAPPPASVIDVGSGASTLVDELLDRGYRDVTVLDVAQHALDRSRARLGGRVDAVRWIRADVTELDVDRTFDVWHDRAVLHFLVDPEARGAYLSVLERAVAPGGVVVLATFGPEGPTTCSGLPVRRYGKDTMTDTLGPLFTPVSYREEPHRTPSGAEQQFAYGVYRRR